MKKFISAKSPKDFCRYKTFNPKQVGIIISFILPPLTRQNVILTAA